MKTNELKLNFVRQAKEHRVIGHISGSHVQRRKSIFNVNHLTVLLKAKNKASLNFSLLKKYN